MKVRGLKEDPQNARLHPERNLDAIRASLEQFGQQKPLVVSADGMVMAGNGVLLAARALGWETVAAVRSNLSARQIRAFAIADNRTGDLSEWDEELLARQLQELEEMSIDPSAVGFSIDDLAELGICMGNPDEGVAEADVPEPPDDPVTRRGDIWQLGDHRLMCGDSASTTDLDRLRNHQVIDLVNMDPPYNVKVEPRSNNAIAAGNSSFNRTHHQKMDLARHPEKGNATHKKMRAKDRPLENDFVTEEAFDEMLLAWFANASRVLKAGGSFYIWGGYANLGNYPAPLKAAGLYFSQGIVWDKQHPVLTRKDFMGAFEICFYGWKKGAGHSFHGPNNATDLWHVKKVNPQSMVHLTEKPVELAVRAIEYSSKPGERVLDLFRGSGSTLIGCEQTDRRGLLMEIDEAYCDVIVNRWEDFTGRKAKRMTGRKPRDGRGRGEWGSDRPDVHPADGSRSAKSRKARR